ncbi:P-loop containing nucleoside triphosphate hydrolase protein [Haematococcus lacustris]
MPVPVAVTNPTGKGLTAALVQSVESEGPFARMARLAAEAKANGTSAAAVQPQNGGLAHVNGHSANQEPTAPEEAVLDSVIAVNDLTFSYPGLDGRPVPGIPPLITGLTFALPRGSRCLLLGANGAGKTTLLKILGGKHMVPEAAVHVLGHPPFHHTQLTISGDLAYVGGNWTRDVAFAGNSVPLAGDFPAQRMIDAVPNVDAARKARLIKVLDIDPQWRMHQVSDGQRRRVQICVGLLKPFKVLLLDEITVDLDVLGRCNLMRFLQEECETRGACIIYATHIFDGLEFWPTHLAYVAHGRLQMLKDAKEVPELQQGKLLHLVHTLLSEAANKQLEERGPRAVEWDPSREGAVDAGFSYAFNNGWVPGTMASSLKTSTNAVMRN